MAKDIYFICEAEKTTPEDVLKRHIINNVIGSNPQRQYFSSKMEQYFRYIFSSSERRVLRYKDSFGKIRAKEFDFVLHDLKIAGEIKVKFKGSRPLKKTIKAAQNQNNSVEYPLGIIGYTTSVILVVFGAVENPEISFCDGDTVFNDMINHGFMNSEIYDYLFLNQQDDEPI